MMTEEINAQKFYEGLLELSGEQGTTSGGSKQELILEQSLEDSLKELSDLKDSQAKL